MHAVCADDEVVLAVRAVCEARADDLPVLVESCDRGAETDGDSVAQDLVEVAVAHGSARPGCTPEGGQVDVEKEAALVVQEALPDDLVGALVERSLEAEVAESPNRVGRKVDAGPGMRPACGTFDDVADDAVTTQRPAGRQTRDPRADDENAFPVGGSTLHEVCGEAEKAHEAPEARLGVSVCASAPAAPASRPELCDAQAVFAADDDRMTGPRAHTGEQERTILVCDDEASLRELVRAILSDGY